MFIQFGEKYMNCIGGISSIIGVAGITKWIKSEYISVFLFVFLFINLMTQVLTFKIIAL